MKFMTWRPEAYIAQTVSICSSFSCLCEIINHGKLPLKVLTLTQTVSICSSFSCSGEIINHGRLRIPRKVLVFQPHTPVVVWKIGTLSKDNADGDRNATRSGKSQKVHCTWLAGNKLTFCVRARREWSSFRVVWKRGFLLSFPLLCQR